MSYDLMVFDPDLAPRKTEIADWYGDVMEEDEDANSSDPASGKSARLRAFYEDMRVHFPVMNGPDATDDDSDDDGRVTGYSFHPGFIYMDFRWSASEAASQTVPALAKKHGLGLFDPQDANDGVMWMGTPNGVAGVRKSWLARLFGR